MRSYRAVVDENVLRLRDENRRLRLDLVDATEKLEAAKAEKRQAVSAAVAELKAEKDASHRRRDRGTFAGIGSTDVATKVQPFGFDASQSLEGVDLTIGEEQLKVPTKFARSLIGPSGENIKLLQQVTGCRTILETEAEGAQGFRILKIKGIPVQRAHCRELVQSHFEAEQKAHVCAHDHQHVDDPIYTAVKIVLDAASARETEDEVDLAKSLGKITQFARDLVELAWGRRNQRTC
eukprot:g8073.t1